MAKFELQIPTIEDFRKVIQEEMQKGFESLSRANSNQGQLQYLSREEAAKTLKITLPTLRDWTKSGRIIAHQIGRRVLYRADEIEKAVKHQTQLVRK